MAGKGESRLVLIFCDNGLECTAAVRHIREAEPEIPIWLICRNAPHTAGDYARVLSANGAMELMVETQKAAWPYKVALSVGVWTGVPGAWPLKLAPFLIPPFRALVMNEQGDFFPGTPAAVARHAAQRVRERALWLWRRLIDLHRGAWLWLFSAVAKHFVGLSRWAFHRWRGNRPLVVKAARDSGTTRIIRHGHRQWKREEVAQAVDQPGARWVLFLEAGAETSTGDLEVLLEEPHAFAASRQMDFRDWKEGLFATAPFRRLQPGEASRVVAPVSRAILADRAKLAALGVPKTIVPGTAWYEWFWKAAAAGWTSYSAGGRDEIAESPDWPYEEAEFVSRVLSDPALRAIGPGDPDLSRGSIAFPIGSARPFRGFPRVLVVAPYLPYPLSHGGAVRIYSLCRVLAPRIDFVLACFRERSDQIEYGPLLDVFREVYVIDREERAATDLGLPRQVREHSSASLRACIAWLCWDRAIDLLQIEFTHLAAFRDAAPGVPAILVEHDLTFMLYRQLADREGTASSRAEYERWLAFERYWLRKYDAVWTMSATDRKQAIAEGSAADTTWEVANGVDIERYRPQPRPSGPPVVFYVGSFRHLPNILGFEKLRQEVMPLVWRECPDAQLRVVAGPDPQRYWRDLYGKPYPAALDSRIEIQGFVADLRPLYAASDVVAVPLLVSAGTNIKVMEAMACGRAVVSTPVGCAGLGLIPGRDAIIEEDWPSFASAICRLLRNPAERDAIAKAGRSTVEARFSWQSIAEIALESYVRLTVSRREAGT